MPPRNPAVIRDSPIPPQTSFSDVINSSSTTYIPVTPVSALSGPSTYINVLPRTSPLQSNLRSTDLEFAAAPAQEADSDPHFTFK